MNELLFGFLFILSSVTAIFFFLLGLRKIGPTLNNYAILFTGIDQILISAFITPVFAKFVCLAFGGFVAVFSLIKIVRKMY